jgi:hypothetical protein
MEDINSKLEMANARQERMEAHAAANLKELKKVHLVVFRANHIPCYD